MHDVRGRAAAGGERHPVREHTADVGLLPDGRRTLVGVVDVDRHVGRAGREDTEDRQVEVGGAGGHPDSDAVTRADTGGPQHRGYTANLLHQLAVGERPAVVEGGGFRMSCSGRLEDAEQRPHLAGRRRGVDRQIGGRARQRIVAQRGVLHDEDAGRALR